MNRVTIKTYAVTHKLSIFNVMKMVKSSQLKSEIIEENGKDVTYILLEDDTEAKIKESIIPIDEDTVFNDGINVENEIRILKEEIKVLKREVELLKNSMQTQQIF